VQPTKDKKEDNISGALGFLLLWSGYFLYILSKSIQPWLF